MTPCVGRSKRNSPFIFDGRTFYLPRPTSVGAGMARSVWFRRWSTTRGEVRIAGPRLWSNLSEQHPIQVLVEQDGAYHLDPPNP